MRPISAVIVAAVAAVSLAACQPSASTSASSNADPSSTLIQPCCSPPPSSPPPSSPGPSGSGLIGPPSAGIGDTLTLTYAGYGNGQGEEDIAVTVIKLITSPSSAEQGFGPEPGDEWVSVEVSVKNLDAEPYVDSPNDSMTAIDVAGQSYPPEEDAPTTAGQQFPDRLALTAGNTATGIVTFGVPDGDTLKTVQFAPGGDGTDVGTWTVG